MSIDEGMELKQYWDSWEERDRKRTQPGFLPVTRAEAKQMTVRSSQQYGKVVLPPKIGYEVRVFECKEYSLYLVNRSGDYFLWTYYSL